ncbi:phosphogluconate dehydratase [Enterovibrio nigricans]|uniref:Phosphogluconate dehydratase n=1 Tax=Enterovibrio nigricans DSM 22720 TaxID=1121868 RepID=A0A1T4UTZ0_9GAMM|nr:phosphogluconate dehydratase [Enterovibrio nigricans]PKF50966.1 phosphogluconate dehydratase [Enterovibrio nigricans]SKA56162.1 6-phosphogluconate dehydratase [Enterovibrio nigricans DSM 22720]
MTHQIVIDVTQRLIERSKEARAAFFARTKAQADIGKASKSLTCGNLAHAVAASCATEKKRILDFTHANVALISAYNDMLSAHQPYQTYPDQIKKTLAEYGHTSQVAGCVPAMCDGVTQGQAGMDMSLFSRDLIAQSTALSLSHNVFDATLLLGICDKIAPGQLMGALAYAHLPTAFVPAGLMPTGISNEEKVDVRQKYAAGEVGKDALQDMECRAYHAPGTCTFYGTANTNQLVFEAMGLMLPGSAFIHPNTDLRTALTDYASVKIASMTAGTENFRPLSDVVTEQSLINGVIALLASGGSTNHTIHMLAVARAAGILLTWQDISDLSEVVPLLARVYPNGPADMNAFQEAGGVPALMKRLDEANLLNRDVKPVFGDFEGQMTLPALNDGKVEWTAIENSLNADVIAAAGEVFQSTGGTRVIKGNLGTAVVKVSAVKEDQRIIEAPAVVFTCQHAVEAAYKRGELNKDCIVVVTHNGPAANGMPELHKLMPILGNIQKAGFKVALVTDGRLSGASGKIPSAIHLSPEALRGGAIGLVRDGDVLSLNCQTGELNNLADMSGREAIELDTESLQETWGRNMFRVMRHAVTSAEEGASFIV